MTNQPLPDDAAAVIAQAAAAEPANEPGPASQVAAKYGISLEPEPKTLADYGIVQYDRTFTYPSKLDPSHTESMAPHGLEPIHSAVHKLTPWPDDGGICALLNDGWRLVPNSYLDDGSYECYDPGNPTSRDDVDFVVLAREVQS